MMSLIARWQAGLMIGAALAAGGPDAARGQSTAPMPAPAPSPTWREAYRPQVATLPAPQIKPWAPAIPAPAPAAPEPSLRAGSLAADLAALGFEPAADNKSSCVVRVQRGTWQAPVTVSLSKGGDHVWMVLIVKPNLPEYEQIPPRTLARLLEVNNAIGPDHFAIDRAARGLTLNLCIPNRGLTPTAFRTQIEAFVDRAIETESYWKD